MTRRHAPAAARNGEPILRVLAAVLPTPATVLELGSGTGEHAVLFARGLPWLTWQPSDPDPESRASTAAWTEREGLANVLPPLHLDLLAPAWRLRKADAVVAVNVLHRAPAGALEALLAGAAEVLPRGGLLLVAGPFRRRGAALAPPLRAMDEALRSAAGGEGLPELEDLVARAAAHDLDAEPPRPLPDGALLVVLRRR